MRKDTGVHVKAGFFFKIKREPDADKSTDNIEVTDKPSTK